MTSSSQNLLHLGSVCSPRTYKYVHFKRGSLQSSIYASLNHMFDALANKQKILASQTVAIRCVVLKRYHCNLFRVVIMHFIYQLDQIPNLCGSAFFSLELTQLPKVTCTMRTCADNTHIHTVELFLYVKMQLLHTVEQTHISLYASHKVISLE